MQTLSDESRRFLEDLKVYLLASGKNEKATQDIVTELENHLQEAESDGKSVAAITGDSPAAYIQSIATEMTTDYHESFWLLFQILAGVFSFLLFQDLLDGPLSYSLYFLVGFILLISSLLIVLSRCLRYSATHAPSKRPFLLFGLSTGVIFLLLMGLFLTDSQITSPTIHFSWLTSSIIGLIAFLLIGYSAYRAKTWVLPLGLLAYLLPQVVIRYGFDGSPLIAVLVGYVCGAVLMTGLFFYETKSKKANQT
ncbi:MULTISPECIES: HAAS domain-containing protein [Exiguobacterium]|uniref:HAAS domain-containing protein n=2 Tax=Bacillales Family XII. Incertae Sedis TaxID=539742 RepID=UPI001AEAD6C1|nr:MULTISPECIES: hypothetical protein [Exiguobacterium]MCT4780710.1 hypothetical protein [Exiguobacterium soli]